MPRKVADSGTSSTATYTQLEVAPDAGKLTWGHITFGVLLNGILVALLLEKFVALRLERLGLFHGRRAWAGGIGRVRRGGRRFVVVGGAIRDGHGEICLCRGIGA